MVEDQVANVLKDIYYDVDNSASFSSIEKLYQEGVKRDPSLTREKVKEWLSSQKVYTLHRPKRRFFARSHVIATAVDDVWQADLVDMQEFKRYNKGYAYILTMVDVLSKFAHALPLKTKRGVEVAGAFDTIFSQRSPSNLQTDQGKEFLNSEVQALLKGYGVHFYTTKDADIKCSIVERFNRTLRGRMFRFFTHKGSHSYLDVLPKLVSSYNNTVHSAINMSPIDASACSSQELFRRLYGYDSKREMLTGQADFHGKMLSVGTTVRIKYHEKLMDKGYYPSWTDEVFTIAKAIKAERPMYILKDHEGEVIEGRFYRQEIQPIKDDTYRIEVIRTRVRAGVKECLVHWIGYTNSQDSWIRESDITDG